MGLEKIYTISRQGELILLVQLEDWKGDRHFMEYQFILEGPSSQYTIHLQHVSGESLGVMTNQTSVRFSTKDRNNTNSEMNCSQQLTGDNVIQKKKKSLKYAHLKKYVHIGLGNQLISG